STLARLAGVIHTHAVERSAIPLLTDGPLPDIGPACVLTSTDPARPTRLSPGGQDESNHTAYFPQDRSGCWSHADGGNSSAVRRQAHRDRYCGAWPLKHQRDTAGVRNGDERRRGTGRAGAAGVHSAGALCL